MTDIRRHGFESAAQWREHLVEIEESRRSERKQESGKGRCATLPIFAPMSRP